MTLGFLKARAGSFRADHHLWIALSHFLSADLIHELAVALVSECSGGNASFQDLFEADVHAANSSFASFSVCLKSCKNGFARYLQRVVRALAWQSDEPRGAYEDDVGPENVQTMRALELAFDLAQQDLGTFKAWTRERTEWPTGIKVMVDALVALDTGINHIDTFGTAEIEKVTQDLDMPLRAILIKHLGDLCADVDRPKAALTLYGVAQDLVGSASVPHWEPLTSSLDSIVLQSRAAMLRLIEGPAEAASLLLGKIGSTSFENCQLLRVNAAVDAMNAQVLATEELTTPEDIRPAVLLAPQLLPSLNLESAFEYWASRKRSDAQRQFWAVLRRQTALGSASLTRDTRAYYARSLIDGLSETIVSERNPDTFGMALRLAIESGREDVAADIEWTEALLDVYLNLEAVAAAIEHAKRAAGSINERHQVVVAIFKGWLLKLTPNAQDVAHALLRFLATMAKDSPWSIVSNRGTKGPSFKALQEVAEQRPEFRSLASDLVTDAIVETLVSGNFRSIWGALDAAAAFADGLEQPDLRRLIIAALDILEKAEPTDNAWPVTRPALGLISSSRAVKLWSQERALGERSASMVLRFGLASESENARLLFLLKDIGPYIDPKSYQASRLDSVVRDLRSRAAEINSSRVTGSIMALLAAPAIVGLDGLGDAIDGLRAILRSVGTQHPSIGLGAAYQPIIQLYEGKDRIEAELNLATGQIHDLMMSLVAPLEAFWRAAADNPLLLTSFAIPGPTTPNPVIVHNWTFATLGFARAVNASAALSAAMEPAYRHPLLGGNMAIARSVLMREGDKTLFDPESIRNEPRSAFYAVLGRRLALMKTLTRTERRETITLLSRQCLEHGPNGLDAGVMALAIDMDLQFEGGSSAFKTYLAKLHNDLSLRFSLTPLLEELETKGVEV